MKDVLIIKIGKTMKHKVLLAFVLGLLVSGIPFAIQSHMLSKQLSSLKNEISLRDEEGVVSIATDKKKYEQGEMVKIILRNNLNRDIFLFTNPTFIIEKREGDGWNTIHEYILPQYSCCGAECPSGPVCFLVSNNTYHIFEWNQTIEHCDWITGVITYEQASAGVYRINLLISFRSAPKEFLSAEELDIIYSNEFTIK